MLYATLVSSKKHGLTEVFLDFAIVIISVLRVSVPWLVLRTGSTQGKLTQSALFKPNASRLFPCPWISELVSSW